MNCISFTLIFIDSHSLSLSSLLILFFQNLGSWDDADYALPSDVVRDQAEVVTPAGRRRPQTAALVDLPPHYDDRSILGHVITSPPKTYQIGTIAAAQTQRVEELVCH